MDRIVFLGNTGSDTFLNLTAVPSVIDGGNNKLNQGGVDWFLGNFFGSDGGFGNDVLRGGPGRH